MHRRQLGSHKQAPASISFLHPWRITSWSLVGNLPYTLPCVSASSVQKDLSPLTSGIGERQEKGTQLEVINNPRKYIACNFCDDRPRCPAKMPMTMFDGWGSVKSFAGMHLITQINNYDNYNYFTWHRNLFEDPNRVGTITPLNLYNNIYYVLKIIKIYE